MSRAPVLGLRQLQVDRMPGLAPAFTIDAKPGVNLILGPNESGKSSLARAVRLLLWPNESAPRPFQVSGIFTDATGPLRAARADNIPEPWQRDGENTTAPGLPPAHVATCYRLGLLDLHRAESGPEEHGLATEIRHQMAGGFAFEPVRDSFKDESNRLKLARKPLREKTVALGKCESKHQKLAEEERGLAVLRAEKAAGETARLHLAQLQAALSCRRLDRELQEFASRLTELPAGAGQARDDDNDQLAGLDQRLADLVRAVAKLDTRLAKRQEQIAATAVEQDTAQLEKLVAATAEQAKTAQQSEQDCATAAASEEAARADLAPELLETATAPGTVDAVRRLLAQHGKHADLQARVEAQEAGLAALAEPEDNQAAGPETKPPTTPIPVLPEPPSTGELAFGIVGLIAGGGLAFANQFAVAAACAGAGLVLLVRNLSERRSYAAARRQVEEFGRAVGKPLTANWSTAAARELMRAAQQETGFRAGARQALAEARDAWQRRRDESRHDRDVVADQRRILLEKFGQDPDRDSGDLAHEWDRLYRWREAATAHAGARGTRDHDAVAAVEALRVAGELLESLGEADDGSLAGVQAAEKRIQGRKVQCASLRFAQETDTEALQSQTSQLSGARDERRRLLVRLELDDEDESTAEIAAQVARRVAAIPTWKLLTENHRVADYKRQRHAAQLDTETASALLEQADPELERRLVVEAEKADTPDDLMTRIGGLEERIRIAREGDDLEEAAAAVDAETYKLSDLLDTHRFGLAGRLLLDDVAGEHERDTMPPVLREMNRLLASFTGGRYELRVIGVDKQPRFVALSPSGARLDLNQLSDGTRAQLLLAARLAFLNTAEEDVRLPLFLDEALTASDPTRFEAVANALGRLAADSGRQIFYLTSNPGDVGAWRQALTDKGLDAPHLIELGVVRRVSAAATVAQLTPPATTVLPAPAEHDAISYARLIGVPVLDPRSAPQAVPLFYLCQDNLPLLHRLLEAGISTLSQWQRLGADLTSAGRFITAETELIAVRGAVFEHFVGLWRIGRGRPLTLQALQDSNAFTDNFLGLAHQLIETLGPDAQDFLDAVRSGRIPGYRTKNKIALQEFLEREIYIDDREQLLPDELVARVLSNRSLDLRPSEVRRLVLGFLSSADPGGLAT